VAAIAVAVVTPSNAVRIGWLLLLRCFVLNVIRPLIRLNR
jgi:hypothetical protein